MLSITAPPQLSTASPASPPRTLGYHYNKFYLGGRVVQKGSHARKKFSSSKDYYKQNLFRGYQRPSSTLPSPLKLSSHPNTPSAIICSTNGSKTIVTKNPHSSYLGVNNNNCQSNNFYLGSVPKKDS